MGGSCEFRLTVMSSALRWFASDHNDHLPSSLDELKTKYVLDGEVNDPPKDTPYIYLGAGKG
jgi:hypothetical protein